MSFKQTYRIKGFEIDLETHWVIPKDGSLDGSPVKLEPRIASLLEILIRHSPELVTREQLIEEVWNNYGGAEDALNHAISQLRKVLNDADKQNRIIETIPKKGYRLRKVDTRPLKTSRSWMLWGAFVLVMLLLGYISYQYFNQQTAVAPPAPNGQTIEQASDSHSAPQPED